VRGFLAKPRGFPVKLMGFPVKPGMTGCLGTKCVLPIEVKNILDFR
jgi:hypothetical protein